MSQNLLQATHSMEKPHSKMGKGKGEGGRRKEARKKERAREEEGEEEESYDTV